MTEKPFRVSVSLGDINFEWKATTVLFANDDIKERIISCLEYAVDFIKAEEYPFNDERYREKLSEGDFTEC